MPIFAVILLELTAFVVLIWALIFLDEPLARWERKTWKKIRRHVRHALKALFDALERIENRINWRTRKIRREICASLLARDGVTVEPVQTERRDLSADFAEVMRLLSE